MHGLIRKSDTGQNRCLVNSIEPLATVLQTRQQPETTRSVTPSWQVDYIHGMGTDCRFRTSLLSTDRTEGKTYSMTSVQNVTTT